MIYLLRILFYIITTCLQFISRVVNSIRSTKIDVSVGIASTGPEAFYYYNTLVKNHTECINSVTVFHNKKNIQFQMFGASQGGRIFLYKDTTDFSLYDYIILHYGKYVFSQETDSMLKYLISISHTNIGVVFILTSEDVHNDIIELTNRYNNEFKSLSFINNVYPLSLENKSLIDTEVQEYFSDKINEMINIAS